MSNERMRTRADGVIEFVNEVTGEVRVQMPTLRNKARWEGKNPAHHYNRRCSWKKNRNGKRLLAPAWLGVWDKPDDWVYLADDPEMQDRILHELSEGHSLKTITKDESMPTYAAIFNLMMNNQDFREKVEIARKIQAERQKDALEELVDEIVDEDSAKVVKGKAEIIKYLMSVNDKERFGGAKVASEGGTSITFVVNTGIDRGEVKTIDAEFTSGAVEEVRAGAELGLLGLGGSQEPQGVRPVQGDGEPMDNASAGVLSGEGLDSQGNAGPAQVRQPSLHQPGTPVPGDEPGQRGRQDGQEAPLDVQQDSLQEGSRIDAGQHLPSQER